MGNKGQGMMQMNTSNQYEEMILIYVMYIQLRGTERVNTVVLDETY